MSALAARTVTGFFSRVAPAHRADAKRVHAVIRKVAPDLAPVVMGDMLGYGAFHYRYATGREGDAAVIALADRATGLALYVNCVKGSRYLAESYAKRLGRVSVGRSCIRFRSAADLDLDALASLVREARTIGGAAKS